MIVLHQSLHVILYTGCRCLILTTVFVSEAYEYKSYTTVHPKSAAARTTHTYYERNKGKPLYVGNLTWVGLTFDSCYSCILILYWTYIFPLISLTFLGTSVVLNCLEELCKFFLVLNRKIMA